MSGEAARATVSVRGGRTMPILGFGTWQLLGEDAYRSVRTALELGYRHLDTATVYTNEHEVGRALADSGVERSEVFITTKLPPDRAGRERETLDSSLAALGTDYVDLWLIHWPPRRGSASLYAAMLELAATGKVRDVGVSNYTSAEMDELIAATGEAPKVNQIRWSPFIFDAATLAESKARDVVLEGYSPFKASRLRDRVVREIASTAGVTPAQVVLRWHIEHGIVVIPKSSHPERIAENLDIFGFSLGEPDMARLDALGRHS